jgi:hypothetical protein
MACRTRIRLTSGQADAASAFAETAIHALGVATPRAIAA